MKATPSRRLAQKKSHPVRSYEVVWNCTQKPWCMCKILFCYRQKRTLSESLLASDTKEVKIRFGDQMESQSSSEKKK